MSPKTKAPNTKARSSKRSASAAAAAEIGIIGGSGLYAMPGLERAREVRVKTPFGEPSDALVVGTLEGRRGASVAMAPTDILTFTLLEGRLIKTLIRVLTPSHASSGDSFLFNVGASRHPMANNLRTLALDGARPVLVVYADPFQALLFPGRAV